MGINRRGLYCYRYGEWQTLMEGAFDQDNGPLRFPVSSPLSDVAVDARGRLYVLASDAGVFEVQPHDLRPVLSINLAALESVRIDERSPDPFSRRQVVGCYPRHLCFAANGDVYVSTGSFGIFAFHQSGGRGVGKQIMLGK